MHVPNDVCVLVANYGIGDHYLVAGFAEAVARQYRLRTCMAGQARLGFLQALYPAVERYLTWPEKVSPETITTSFVRGGALFHAHFPGLELMRAVGYNGFHFLDAYRCRFGLPVEARLTRPCPPTPAEVAAAARCLRDLGCEPGRTILLSTEAGTTPTDGITARFWLALAEELRAADLVPLVNAGPATVVPEGMAARMIPLAEVRAMALAAGGFCSVRSGLSDLVCDLPCPQAVVYAPVRYWAGSLLAGTTFQRYGLARPPLEVEFAAGAESGLAAELAAFFAREVAEGRPMPASTGVA